MTGERIRTIIVDDEALGRQAVRELLERDDRFEIVDECKGGAEAITTVRATKPHVILLDIQMPEVDGFDVLMQLADQTPHVVMVTAFDQYAIRAFEHHALDYVLKPVDPDRFQITLDRVADQVLVSSNSASAEGIRALLDSITSMQHAPARIVIKVTGSLLLLEPDELAWIEAAGNYLRVHVGDRSYLTRDTITAMAQRLSDPRFLRIHRSVIVNAHRVREVRTLPGGSDHAVILTSGTELPIGRSYHASVTKALSLLGTLDRPT